MENSDLDDLIRGIRTYISDNKNSMSEEDISLLEDCVRFLEQMKLEGSIESQENLLLRIIEIIVRILSI